MGYHSHREAPGLESPHPPHGPGEGMGIGADLIMDLLIAVNGKTHPADRRCGQPFNLFFHHISIGDHHHFYSALIEAPGQRIPMGVEEGFPTGESKQLNLQIGQLVTQIQGLIQVQFIIPGRSRG